MSDEGLNYLTKLLTLALVVSPGNIQVHDGEQWSTHLDPADAARVAQDVDDIVTYHIGEVALKVIYDGPYTTDNAVGIINDSNDAGEALCAKLAGIEPKAGSG